MVLFLLMSQKQRDARPPRAVIIAFWLWIASTVLRFLALVSTALSVTGPRLLALVVFAVLFTAVEVLVGFALRRGIALARILLVGVTVFGSGGFGGSWWWSLATSMVSAAACVLTFVPAARGWFARIPRA